MLALRAVIAALCCCTLAVCSSVCRPAMSPPLTCADCIGLHHSCVWCTDADFDDKRMGPQQRCGTKEQLRSVCRSLEAPAGNQTVDSDNELSDKQQIRPQKVTLKMRMHQPQTFNFNFTLAVDYPMDLYILSDKSHSMYNFLQKVASLSDEIQKTLRNLTQNWGIGVGFFVDKPLYPYVHPNMKAQCDIGGGTCARTFSYIHAMHIGQDAARLRSVTGSQTVSANLDAPEGALDALLQAVSCGRMVGWRTNSRKVVLLAVDGGFHMAGDGRFGGIVEPYPEAACHLEPGDNKLNISGSLEYVNATRYDYPSVGQVAKVLSENKVSVIFAVKNSVDKPIYQQLQQALPVITEVDEIKTDEVVQLIRKNYKSIAETVKINWNNPGSHLNVSVQVKCPGQSEFAEGDECKAVALGQLVQFRAVVTLNRCEETKVKFRSTTSDDELTVDIQPLCTCPQCEAKADPTDKVANCSGHGYMQCGVCKCDAGRGGDTCECTQKEGSGTSNCLTGSTTCSGKGRCVCNKCVCYQSQYFGDKCEKDRSNCPESRDTQETCGGPGRGVCDGNGTCTCINDHAPPDCTCKKNMENATHLCVSKKPEYAGKICAGHGTCLCGKCLCESAWSSDPNCDTKAGSTGTLCGDQGLKDCVRCIFTNRQLPPERRADTCNCSFTDNSYHIDEASVKLTTQKEIVEGKSTCLLPLGNDCHLLFGYQMASRATNVSLFIQEDMQCRERVSVLALVLIVIAAVVLIGIAILLIWKLLITISDRREFAKFKQLQQENSRWGAGVNPIFKDPNVVVDNPIFEGHAPS